MDHESEVNIYKYIKVLRATMPAEYHDRSSAISETFVQVISSIYTWSWTHPQ